MAIVNVEHYTQDNGARIIKVFLTPTKKFPEGKNYLFTNESLYPLVKSYDWRLVNRSGSVFVVTKVEGKEHYFHDMYLTEIKNRCNCDGLSVTHINGVGYDNVTNNLFVNMPYRYNLAANGFQKLYHYDASSGLWLADIPNTNGGMGAVCAPREDDVLMRISSFERLREASNPGCHTFNFLRYRRCGESERILDAERKGEIASDMAVLLHASQYVNNAWYILRFPHLYDFICGVNAFPVPKYAHDSTGQMIDAATGKPLCPI